MSANIIVSLEALLKKKHILGRINERRLEKAIELLRKIKFQWK